MLVKFAALYSFINAHVLRRLKYQFLQHNPVKSVLRDAAFAQVRTLKRFTEGQTRLFGQAFRFPDNRGFLHSLEEIFTEQVYKFQAATPAPVIIDAGANIGLSVAYFKRLYPAAKITAFEPDPRIFSILQRNIASLGLKGVEARNAAAWIADTELEFFSEGSLAGSTEVAFVQESMRYKVKAERLKSFLTGEPVDFLKIDIEGAENTVVFDLEPELSQVRHLFLEYHSVPGKEQMLGELLNVVKRAGFRYTIKTAADPSRYPFTDRIRTGFDLQLNIFCFRDQTSPQKQPGY
jgi:FkbM family methyltransferase